jgi:hypothetical protein
MHDQFLTEAALILLRGAEIYLIPTILNRHAEYAARIRPR